MKVNTIPGAFYALTCTTACTVKAVRHDATLLTLLEADKAGQFSFVAPTDTVEISDENALVTQSFKKAVLGLSAQGGESGFYVTVDEDGTRRTHHQEKLVRGDGICSSYCYTDTNQDVHYPVILENVPFSSLVSARYMFYQVKLESFALDVPLLADGNNMFANCSYLERFTSDLPSLVYARLMFAECSSLKHFFSAVPLLSIGDTMFAQCSSLSRFTSELPSLTDGRQMFGYCSSLESFSSGVPLLWNGALMFTGCTKLASFSSALPTLRNGSSMFNNCRLMESFSSELPELSSANSMFSGCSALSSFSVGLPALTSGTNMFKNCNLDAATIDAILESLPAMTDGKTHVITFTGCPGAESCNASIGTAKGWVVLQ